MGLANTLARYDSFIASSVGISRLCGAVKTTMDDGGCFLICSVFLWDNHLSAVSKTRIYMGQKVLSLVCDDIVLVEYIQYHVTIFLY